MRGIVPHYPSTELRQSSKKTKQKNIKISQSKANLEL